VRVRDKTEFFSGLALIGFGLAALLIARTYKMGTAFRMGPAYFPVVLALLLIAIGVIVAGLALRSTKVTSPKLAWRPMFVVTAAVVLFGLIIDGAGLALSTFALVLASRFARSGYPWGETAILGFGLSVLCALIFHFGLRIQMPLLPAW
jgi:putative tricarboxylic transport membrane protein